MPKGQKLNSVEKGKFDALKDNGNLSIRRLLIEATVWLEIT